MKASDFVTTYASRGLAEWEKAAVQLAAAAENVQWPMVPVPVATADGRHRGTFYVASDYFAVGEPGDVLRLPLTPGAAQRVADGYGGMLLPTPRMVDAIWRASTVRATPIALNNRGADLNQYAQHSRLVDREIERLGQLPGSLASGTKKDVVVLQRIPPGKVAIYGWHRPDGTHIQPRSTIHGSNYVDYSHGVRLVAPNMEVDGQARGVEEVLRDRELSQLLSDEGPVDRPRYDVRGAPLPRAFSALSLGDVSFDQAVRLAGFRV